MFLRLAATSTQANWMRRSSRVRSTDNSSTSRSSRSTWYTIIQSSTAAVCPPLCCFNFVSFYSVSFLRVSHWILTKTSVLSPLSGAPRLHAIGRLVLIQAKVTGRSLAVSESRQRIPSRPTVSGTGGTWQDTAGGPVRGPRPCTGLRWADTCGCGASACHAPPLTIAWPGICLTRRGRSPQPDTCH